MSKTRKILKLNAISPLADAIFAGYGYSDSCEDPDGIMVRSAQMADYSVVTSDNPRREDPRGIIADIAEAMDAAGGAYEIIEDRGEAIRAAVRLTEAGDMLVVAGKGHETIQIIGNESRHFDDREELKKGRKL